MEEAVIFRATPEIASHLRDATRGARSDVGLTMRVVGMSSRTAAIAREPAEAPHASLPRFVSQMRPLVSIELCAPWERRSILTRPSWVGVPELVPTNFRCAPVHFAPSVDLPCIIEMHKTADHQEYAKSGNVSKVGAALEPRAAWQCCKQTRIAPCAGAGARVARR